MQISTSLFYSNASSRLTKMSDKAQELQTQIATGKKLIKPSDDPAGAQQLAELDRRDAALFAREAEEMAADHLNSATLAVELDVPDSAEQAPVPVEPPSCSTSVFRIIIRQLPPLAETDAPPFSVRSDLGA